MNKKNSILKEKNYNNYINYLIQNNNNNENIIKPKTRNNINSCLYHNPNGFIQNNLIKNKNPKINIGLSFNEKKVL